MKPIALFTGREVSLALDVAQPRFARAIRNGKIRADFIANGARGIDLFLPASVCKLAAKKEQLFPIR